MASAHGGRAAPAFVEEGEVALDVHVDLELRGEAADVQGVRRGEEGHCGVGVAEEAELDRGVEDARCGGVGGPVTECKKDWERGRKHVLLVQRVADGEDGVAQGDEGMVEDG